MSHIRLALRVDLSINFVFTNYAALPRMSRGKLYIFFYDRLHKCESNFLNEVRNCFDSVAHCADAKDGSSDSLNISRCLSISHLLARIRRDAACN